MKKKKNVVLVVVGILLLVCLYFGYKGFNLFYYNDDRITTQDYDDFISQFTISPRRRPFRTTALQDTVLTSI